MLALLFLLLAPPEAQEAYQRGTSLIAQGRAGEALPHFQRAAGLDPANAQYWKALGVTFASMELLRDSVEPFSNACKLAPELEDACYYLGRSLYATDRYREALAPLATALRVDRVKGRAETALAQCREALGEDRAAEAGFRAALGRKDGAQQQSSIGYGRFLIRQGRAQEAARLLEGAQIPESAESRYVLGLAYSQSSRILEAVAALERAVALQPGHQAAGLLLAKLRVRLTPLPQ
ncbi:MAG: tetratricopeptide repeat protein [Acidobacteria bacterium]|nr:tetratricopeptide repeat protein [Acidobacteriota bacterium]